MVKLFYKNYYNTSSRFIYKVLTDPKDLLIQKRLKLDTTPLGFPLEFRIDYLDGEPVNIKNRYFIVLYYYINYK